MESNPFVSNFSATPTPGDFVVGRYNALGSAIESGTPLIPEAKVKKLRESMARSAYTSGGKIVKDTQEVKTKAKKSKPKKLDTKSKNTAFPTKPILEFNLNQVIADIAAEENSGEGYTYTETLEENIAAKAYQPPEKKKKIIFSNDFGNIKVYAEDVLTCDMAVALVFKDEEALTFVPKIGEALELKIEDEEPISVYFPGSIFTWTDNVKNVIILFKNNE